MNLRPLLFVVCTTTSFFLISHFFTVKQLGSLPISAPSTENITPSDTTLVKEGSSPESENKVDPNNSNSTSRKKALPIAIEAKALALKSETMQVIFDINSASISEINLPHKSISPTSVILPIEADEKAQKIDGIGNFPIKEAYLASGKKISSQMGGYHPLLRRGTKADPMRKEHYAFSLSSIENKELIENLIFKPVAHTEKSLSFQAHLPKSTITKTFTLNPKAPYSFDLEVEVSGAPLDLWVSSGVLETELISKKANSTICYKYEDGGKVHVESTSLPKDSSKVSPLIADWVSSSNGFFGIVMRPKTALNQGFKTRRVEAYKAQSRLSHMDTVGQFSANDLCGYEILLPLQARESKLSIYSGPYHRDILAIVDSAAEANGEKDPEVKQASSFFGWFAFISEPFAKLLFVLINFFHSWTGSWGISIILLTIALRVMLYPLNAWGIRSQIKMQKLGPELAAIKAKHSKDPKKANLEQMNLYRQRGVNPISGCLPMIIQLPFLIGMFDLLKSTFQLRGASFIPGWINNLAAPDVLFTWGYHLPVLGNEFHLLPILNALGMLIQQKVSSKLPKDSSLWTDQQRQQKVMGNVMAVVLLFIFYNMPAGLNIYFLSSMVLAIFQQWTMEKYMKKKAS